MEELELARRVQIKLRSEARGLVVVGHIELQSTDATTKHSASLLHDLLQQFSYPETRRPLYSSSSSQPHAAETADDLFSFVLSPNLCGY